MKAMKSKIHTAQLLDARQKLAAVERFSIEKTPAQRRAAVLIPIILDENHPEHPISVLFTKRTDKVSTHKGQVSFPGGMIDPEDHDEIAAALRETEEEIGIKPHQIDVWGLFHDAKAITGTPVTSVVGVIDTRTWSEPFSEKNLNVSQNEIDTVFRIPLPKLVDPTHLEIRDTGVWHMPVFNAGPFPVWGLTAFFLHEALRVLFDAPWEPVWRPRRG